MALSREPGVDASVVARCRELLGDEAVGLSDQQVNEIRRHADLMARVLIQCFIERKDSTGFTAS